MRTRAVYPWTVIAVGLVLQVLGAPSPLIAGSSGIHVVPNKVHISASFRRASVSVSAEIPKNSNATVELDGPPHDERLLRKGRRGGLWMTVGEITVHRAPSVYLRLLTLNSPDDASSGTPGGYEALKKNIEFRGDISDQGVGAVFDQFVKLKEAQGLYGVFPKGLKVIPASDQDHQSTVEGHFTLPDNIAPGHYRVVLSVANNGKIMERRSADLLIDMTGIPGFLHTLAYRHPVWHGVAAVFIAIVVGYVMGLLFSGKAAH